MEFFKTLAELATEKIQFQIGITIEKGTAVVTVVPKTAAKSWTPFVMRGSPEELDQDFLEQLENLKAALGIISNASTYADTIKKEAAAKPATPAATPSKTLASPGAKKVEPKKEEKKAAPVKKEEPKKEEPDTDEDDSLGLFD